VGCGEGGEEAEVLFQCAGGDLNPAGTCWHGAFQGSVYRGRRGPIGTRVEQGVGDDGFAAGGELVEEPGLQFVGHRHFTSGYLGFRGADKAKLAAADSLFHADGRAEDAAGHGPPSVDAAKARGWIERGAGSIVGEVLEAFAVEGGVAEQAGGGVAGEDRPVLGDPSAGAALDCVGRVGVGVAEGFHPGLEAQSVEGIDGEGTMAALGAARAAGEMVAGAAGGFGEGRIEDLDEFSVGGGKAHQGQG